MKPSRAESLSGGNHQELMNEHPVEMVLDDDPIKQSSDEDVIELEDLIGLESDEALIETGHAGTALELFFDDEPIELVLRGINSKGPNPANLFLPTEKRVASIRGALSAGYTEKALHEISEVGRAKLPISLKACFGLAEILEMIVPTHPMLTMNHNLSSLCEVIGQIWAVALDAGEKDLQKSAGTPIYRWYEQHQEYRKARDVIKHLIDIHHDEGDSPSEAGMINNLGCVYLLEEQWSAAMPCFEKAALIFEKEGVRSRWANARANLWLCRTESAELVDLPEAEREVVEIAEILDNSTFFWQRRKPLLIQAKLKEQCGQIDEAVKLAKAAIDVTMGSGTIYTQIDEIYLRRLQAKTHSKSSSLMEDEVRHFAGEPDLLAPRVAARKETEQYDDIPF